MSDRWRMSPPEPFADYTANVYCPWCGLDADHDCVQWNRLCEVEAYCTNCGHHHTFELETPDDF